MSSKGGSHGGGGKSSLGYLFGSDDLQPISKSTASPPAVKAPWDDDNSTAKPPNNNSSKKLNVSNNYHRAQGQNSGNFLTVSDHQKDRPTTKVQSAPGGESSLGYLFGEK